MAAHSQIWGVQVLTKKYPFLEIWGTRHTRQHSPNGFARTRQIRKRQVWQVLGKFGKFSELEQTNRPTLEVCVRERKRNSKTDAI